MTHPSEVGLGLTSVAPVLTDDDDSETEQRLRNAEAAIDMLRDTTSEREIALMRADLERLRQESEKASGSKLP
jgi:hypothetical protein